MDHLRHQKHKNKRLKSNFKIINISLNDMDLKKNKFEKKRTNKEENIKKKHLV